MRIFALSLSIVLIALSAASACAQKAKPDDKKVAPSKPTWSPYSSIQQFKIISAVDADLDGTITMKEIEASVERIKKLDTNGDGKLTSAEFLNEGKIPGSVLTFGVVKGLDADKDGELSADEIKVAVEVLKKLDANKSNSLDSYEYAMKSPMGMNVSSDNPGAGGPGGGAGGGGGGRQMPSPEEFVKTNDKNGNGTVEKSELTGMIVGFFDRMDTDKNGSVTVAEVKASRERMRQQNAGGAGGGGRGGSGGAAAGGGGAAGEKKADPPKADAPKTDAPK